MAICMKYNEQKAFFSEGFFSFMKQCIIVMAQGLKTEIAKRYFMKKEIDPVLQMRHITKTFGSVTANRDVDLSVYPGEIHALLGENGAGKSTLMNILTGIYRPDGGEIWYKGQKRDIHSPKDAVALGIGMVHQHFRLIPTLTVAENVYICMIN